MPGRPHPRGASSRRVRWLSFLAALAVAIAAFNAGERIYRSYVERNWPALQREEEDAQGREIQSAFSAYQGQTLQMVRRVGASEALRRAMSLRADSGQTDAFEALSGTGSRDVSLELYDSVGQLLGWTGNRGPEIDPRVLEGKDTSFVVQGPLYSTFVVTLPITSPPGILVAKRLFDVNYPINNRFINNAAFTSTFTASLDIVPEFDFLGGAPDTAGGYFAVPLKRDGGGSIGFALMKRPMLPARLDDLAGSTGRINRLILCLIAAVLTIAGVRSIGSNRSAILRATIFTIGIWALRYFLIWADIPRGLIRWGLFEPTDFASPLGFGIAKSLGDFFLSAVALFLNIVILDRIVRNARKAESPQPHKGLQAMFSIGAVVALVFVLLLLMRGFAAVVHSAVYDSTLAYNDPTSVIPSFELSVMLAALTLVALALIIAGVGMLNVCHRLVVSIPWFAGGRFRAWGLLAFVVAAGSIVFGAAQPTPLMSQGFRLLILAAFMLTAAWIEHRGTSRGIVLDPRVLASGCAVAIVLVIALLDQTAHELDRTHVELMANEIVRPEDSWLTLLVNQTLDELSGADAADVLASGDSDDVEKLAFTEWARSVLSKEGNNCSVAYASADGVILSNFHIGIAPRPFLARRIGIAPQTRSVHTEEKSQNGVVVKWCIGYAPIVSDSGESLGGVWVEVSGSRQTILRGEAPEILRNYTREKFETHFRTFIISEYFQGRVIFTTAENMPLDRQLPSDVLRLADAGKGFWWDDVVDGKHYETYSLPERGTPPNASWIALGMETLGSQWHLYSFLRYIVFYSLLGALVFLLAWMIRLIRGGRVSPSFRMRVMTILITVSVIPVVILVLYNRQYSRERGRDNMVRRLSDQTSVVVAEVQRQLGANVPAALAELTDDRCSEIANDLNTDFNVYSGSMLQASSKPEMFTAELLDPRVSADAYLNIVLRKKEFFYDNQSIGNYPYVVGYRPLDAENDSVIGIVSVPTLYRQAEMDEDLARRNVFLYGAYAVAAALSVIIGTFFANQISSPIRRLKQATQEIASGRLDVDLPGTRRDELGELEQAFKQMTRDLKRTQEEIAKTQRELAWKEMARQVAHEIKNPLTPIKLSIQHLRQAYTDEVRDFAGILQQVSETILAQIEALNRIASEFSHFARMPERRLEVCDLHEIIAEARNLFLQQEGVQFRMELTTASLQVSADREELRRAFINIIRNSVQAMGERGTITVRTSRADGLADVRLADTGPGIPPEVRSHLFEPNFSTKTDGMGLGLAIVRKIIDDLGGSIAIASEQGRGTTVTITLPLAEAGEESGRKL